MTTWKDPLAEIPRKWGKPLIQQDDGSDPIPYERASKLAGVLDDTWALNAWKQRLVVLGMGQSPHLTAEAHGLLSADEWALDNERAKLNSIADRAREAGGESRASSVGTAIHAWTEAYDRGKPPQAVPAEWVAHIAEYVRATAAIKMISIEDFIVTDEVQAAGTFDRLAQLPDGRVVIADLKGLAVDTPILTVYSGWHTMGTLAVGDYIYDHEMVPTKIVAKSEVKRLDCYEITFSTGETIVADEEHLWRVHSIRDAYGTSPQVHSTEHLFNELRYRGFYIFIPGRTSKTIIITKMKKVDPSPTQCIAVDSPSHTYMAGKTLIPTHNTGSHDPRYPMKPATQMAIYSRGKRYDPATGQRSILHPDLDTSVGLLMHMPAKTNTPKLSFYLLDLNVGWFLAQRAAELLRLRKLKPITPYNPMEAA